LTQYVGQCHGRDRVKVKQLSRQATPKCLVIQRLLSLFLARAVHGVADQVGDRFDRQVSELQETDFVGWFGSVFASVWERGVSWEHD
jgi:hypothetical protein